VLIVVARLDRVRPWFLQQFLDYPAGVPDLPPSRATDSQPQAFPVGRGTTTAGDAYTGLRAGIYQAGTALDDPTGRRQR
jgi:hypothetical protein